MENDYFIKNKITLDENMKLYNDNFEKLKLEEYLRLKNHQESLLKEINDKILERNAFLENKILLSKGANEHQHEEIDNLITHQRNVREKINEIS